MKWGVRYLVICLLASLAICAQAGQKAEQAGGAGEPPPSKHPPTLAPQRGPSLGPGLVNTSTTDLRRLMRIHTLYIESIDNSLSDKLVETLGTLKRFRLVTKEKDADAIVRGSCLESRRLKRVHSEIFISDRNGASVWQDTIYRPYNPPTLDRAVSDTATLVAAHLAQTVQRAEH